LHERSSGNAPRASQESHAFEFARESRHDPAGTTLGTSTGMADLLEILATPFFAVIDFALAAPATALAIASAGTIAAMLVVNA
jgi:hypothetical protein